MTVVKQGTDEHPDGFVLLFLNWILHKYKIVAVRRIADRHTSSVSHSIQQHINHIKVNQCTNNLNNNAVPRIVKGPPPQYTVHVLSEAQFY